MSEPPAPRVPRVALAIGDPAGIGPEIALAALGDERVRSSLSLVALGPARLCPTGVQPRREMVEASQVFAGDLQWIDTGGPERWRMGAPERECGRAALAALRAGAELGLAGRVDALVTCPVSKKALQLAGEAVEGQTELLARWAHATRCEMVAVAGALRIMLLTRHMPLRQAVEQVSIERVLDRLILFHEALRAWGFPSPRLAVAGLNPHAGEDGLLGSEESDVLAPALAQARERGIQALGPLSPDSIFARGARGEFDGVLALFHDQAFIPIKLLAPDTGFTVLAGLPYLRFSPVHGTAFDIAGRGTASPANLIACLLEASRWCLRRASLQEVAPTRPG